MHIRKSVPEDLQPILIIYQNARLFMSLHGNPNQWGPTNWPPETLVKTDITEGKSYVCIHRNRIVGTFYFTAGTDIEPTYEIIEDGAWLDSSAYGVVHRIASDGSVRGVGKFCLDWAYSQCGHLRIDTHPDNTVMQGLLKKCGFVRCGIIHVEEDPYPRFAFEKSRQIR